MRLFRRARGEQVDRRRPENAELRRQIDIGQKQTNEYLLADAQRRIDQNGARVARLDKIAEVLNIRAARKARDS